MTHDEYCITVCGGRCCNHSGYRCNHLLSDNSCGIHDRWVDNWCHYEDGGFSVLPIKEALDKKLLPDEVVEKCCYAHPEFLEEKDNGRCHRRGAENG